MKTLVLGEFDLQNMIHQMGVDRFMDELIHRIHCAFVEFDTDFVDIPQRNGFHYENPTGLVEWMPLHQKGHRVVMKLV